LREIVRREANAPLRQIEAERVAHRTAKPGIAVCLRRPDPFDQTAQHQPIDRLQTRFEQAENADTRAGLGAVILFAGDGGVEQPGIVGGGDVERAGPFELGERLGKLRRHAAQRSDHLSMAGGHRRERMRAARQGFQRRQRVFKLCDEGGRGVKLGIGQRQARIGMMQRGGLVGAIVGKFVADRRQRALQARGAVLGPRTAQDRALQRHDARCVEGGRWMLEQRQ
jgi:hypothetical protein